MVSATLALLAIAAGWSERAQAQDPYFCLDSLSDDAVSYRLRRIEQSFDRGRHDAIGWRVGWIGGYVALASAQTALAIDAARDGRPWDRFAFAYQAAGGFALALGLAVIPARDTWGAKRLAKRDASTPEARRDKLRYATRLMERGAKVQELLSRGELIGLGVAFGVAGGTVKAVKWPGKTRLNTALMYVIPPILATGTVLSAPRNLVEDWESYRGMACSERYYNNDVEGPDFDFSMSPSGMRFSVSF
ncbi:MAG: hypothetical protein AAF500_16335 [Myxococcota bacterium]